MEYRDEKRRLYHMAVELGLPSDHDFAAYTGVPRELVKKWMKQFFAPPKMMLACPLNPQLVNKFSLGADPEYAFVDVLGKYCHAQDVGMSTILPFGCDMAGRQAELRAHSSRFALEVVASLVDALRWIPQFYDTDHLKWVAMPYVGNDGCGGHIHFGRKRPTRDAEVRLLDNAFFMLTATGVFNPLSVKMRGSNTKFGGYGDYRLQSHGYEYRSFPTWMYSPWGAYFTLVISKLMLYHGVNFQAVRGQEMWQLINLLRLYRNVDDDAAIALKAWHQRGFPIPDEKCFRERWGVEKKMQPGPPRSLQSLYFPLSLVPEEKTVIELWQHLSGGWGMPQRAPKPNWEPFELGRDFSPVRVQPHVFEIPNIAQGLVSKYYRVSVAFARQVNTIDIMGAVEGLDKRAIVEHFNALDVATTFSYAPHDKGLYFQIGIPKVIMDDREKVKQVRSILADTQLFPVCKGEDIRTADWSKWDNPVDMLQPKMYGKVLATVRGQKVPLKPKLSREEF